MLLSFHQLGDLFAKGLLEELLQLATDSRLRKPFEGFTGPFGNIWCSVCNWWQRLELNITVLFSLRTHISMCVCKLSRNSVNYCKSCVNCYWSGWLAEFMGISSIPPNFIKYFFNIFFFDFYLILFDFIFCFCFFFILKLILFLNCFVCLSFSFFLRIFHLFY